MYPSCASCVYPVVYSVMYLAFTQLCIQGYIRGTPSRVSTCISGVHPRGTPGVLLAVYLRGISSGRCTGMSGVYTKQCVWASLTAFHGAVTPVAVHIGFVPPLPPPPPPLQDAALHQCLPLSSVYCFPVSPFTQALPPPPPPPLPTAGCSPPSVSSIVLCLLLSSFTFHPGFVHPLQDVALHQCLPLSSVCCFPDPGGSLIPCYVVLPSSAWSSS